MAAAAAPALPDWVMLERFVFRRDDPKSFRGDNTRTSATCTTCTGTRFDVSFVLADPPTPSLVYLSWPAGPLDEMVCHLMAAHRDLVLLRLDSLFDPSDLYASDVRNEYFIYIAHPAAGTSQPPHAPAPLLRPLPQCMRYDEDLLRPVTCPFSVLSVGLLCRGEDELKAELWLLRSSSSYRDDGGSVTENWERKLLPILYDKDEEVGELQDLLFWVVDEVVPFNDSLCWVNYASGVLVYTRFPENRSTGRDDPRMALCRSLCVTDGGSRLSLVDVARHDDAPAFTFTVRTVEMLENGAVLWQPIDEALKVVITSAQLRDASNDSMPLPVSQDRIIFPLFRMDVPNTVVHPLCSSIPRLAGCRWLLST